MISKTSLLLFYNKTTIKDFVVVNYTRYINKTWTIGAWRRGAGQLSEERSGEWRKGAALFLRPRLVRPTLNPHTSEAESLFCFGCIRCIGCIRRIGCPPLFHLLCFRCIRAIRCHTLSVSLCAPSRVPRSRSGARGMPWCLGDTGYAVSPGAVYGIPRSRSGACGTPWCLRGWYKCWDVGVCARAKGVLERLGIRRQYEWQAEGEGERGVESREGVIPGEFVNLD